MTHKESVLLTKPLVLFLLFLEVINWSGYRAINTVKKTQSEKKIKRVLNFKGSEMYGSPLGQAVFRAAEFRDLETTAMMENYLLEQKKGIFRLQL